MATRSLGSLVIGAAAFAMGTGTILMAAGAPAAANPASRPTQGAQGEVNFCGPPADTVPPVMTSVSLAKSSLDVKASAATQTISVQAQDMGAHASGVTGVFAQLVGPKLQSVSVAMHLASGTAINGTWTGSGKVDPGGPGGTWKIGDIELRDAAGNLQDYEADAFSPTTLQQFPKADWQFSVTSVAKAVKPGTLKKFSLAPSKVNTTKQPAKVTATAGFKGTQPTFVSAAVSTNNHAIGELTFVMHRAGPTWKGAATIPQWAGNSNFVATLYTSYEAPNFGKSPTQYYDPQKLAKLGNTTVKVISGTDKTPPKLTDLSLSKSTVNTDNSPGSLMVTAKATDKLSGVDRVEVDFAPASPAAYGEAGGVLKKHGSSFTGTIKFPQCMGAGRYHIYVEVNDRANNYASYTSTKLRGLKLPNSVKVESHPGDFLPPYVAKSTVNTTTQTVTLKFSEPVANVTVDNLTLYDVTGGGDVYADPIQPTAVTCYESDGATPTNCSGTAGQVLNAALVFSDLPAGGADDYEIWANINGNPSQLTDLAGNPLAYEEYAAHGSDL